MNESVERVAKAMWNADGSEQGVSAYPDFVDYLPLARAAIEAMRGNHEQRLEMARRVYSYPAARTRFISLYNAADMVWIQESAMADFIDAVLFAALDDAPLDAAEKQE